MIAAIRRAEDRALSADQARRNTARMVALVQECITSGIARQACIVHLSRLPGTLQRPHHLRMARTAIEPLVQADRARLFELPNHDLVVIWRDATEKAVTASREGVIQLLPPGDPTRPRQDLAAALAEEPIPAQSDLWEHLSLPRDAGRLLILAEDLLAQSERQPSVQTAPPLDPVSLLELEALLVQADVARFARRKQICVRTVDGSFRLRWEKRYLSIAELGASLAPERSLTAEPWLFRRLTRSLDSRMLALLAAPDELHGAGAFSLNLNVASILAPDFLRFDDALPANLRGHVILNLLPTDVLADSSAFMFARDFALSRGYPLLLRDVSLAFLQVFPLSRTGADFIELTWTPALVPEDLSRMVHDVGRVVLSRADTPQAVTWGHVNGISLFQGRSIVPSDPRFLR
jgi:hypothetical protein